jgi:allantoin racemase
MIHVRIISPVTGELFLDDQFASYCSPEQKFSHVKLRTGPASIESSRDEAMAQPDTIVRIMEAEQEGCDAVVINCFGDTALEAGREMVDIPVVGPCQASMHLAAMLGGRFGVVAHVGSVRTQLLHLAGKYGLGDLYGGFRAVNIPALDLRGDLERLQRELNAHARALVEHDGVNSVIVGCTAMFGCVEAIRRNLLAENIDVPVIDPLLAAMNLAVILARAGLTQSRRAYNRSTAERRGYSLLHDGA